MKTADGMENRNQGATLALWVLLLWGGWILLRRILIPALARRRGGTRWASVAVGAAILAAMVHAVVDFSLQLPANAFLTAVLLGVLTGAAEDENDSVAASVDRDGLVT